MGAVPVPVQQAAQVRAHLQIQRREVALRMKPQPLMLVPRLSAQSPVLLLREAPATSPVTLLVRSTLVALVLVQRRVPAVALNFLREPLALAAVVLRVAPVMRPVRVV
jgi:hypothetical protein